MTLFFDLKKLESKANSNYTNFVEILRLHYLKKTIPRSYKDKVKPVIGLHGQSFLLNPKPLFYAKVDLVYKVQYIKLAARRNYIDYKLYGNKYLDVLHFPDLNVDAIQYNPLLKINDNKLYFKYEEI
jgi:hypothetical protein